MHNGCKDYNFASSLIVSNGVSIWLYLKNRKLTEHLYIDSKQKEKIKDLHDKLFQIQKISIDHPYLEDKKFIDGWNDFKKRYHTVGTQRIWPARAFTLGHLTHNDLATVRI